MKELGVEIRTTSGPALNKKGDLAALLTSLPPFSIFFIDEIHRLSKDARRVSLCFYGGFLHRYYRR